jgi:hypothetical protein
MHPPATDRQVLGKRPFSNASLVSMQPLPVAFLRLISQKACGRLWISLGRPATGFVSGTAH